ncbi:non-canonical purine NTP pyrophosphatase [Brevundimonas sp.]|uniref:non-canonical purine NTP pyrophosphatase n=1 Tax=Brevundimonas sp. TaxID=1871086 RepID=UPI003D09F2B2
MRLRFLSRNADKIAEATSILGAHGINVVAVDFAIDEIQTNDIRVIAKRKALEAFKRVGRPLFVEHTGLFLPAIGDLPGGLTQVFWDALEADRFCEILEPTGNRSVIAKTALAYCDGRKIHLFEGEIAGQVPLSPKGDRKFQWDCAFVPEGYSETFAELGSKKNDISMRKIALERLVLHLGVKS